MNHKETIESIKTGDLIPVHVSDQSGTEPENLAVVETRPHFMGQMIFVRISGRKTRVALGVDKKWWIASRR